MAQGPEAPPTPPPAGRTPRRADLGKRFLAALIDGVLAAILSTVLGTIIPIVGGVVGGVYMLVRDGMDLSFMDHRSIGKKIMKLRPVTASGSVVDLGVSVRRNWMFALGSLAAVPIIGWFLITPIAAIIGIVEIVLVLTDASGRRWGDKLAETTVIEVDA